MKLPFISSLMTAAAIASGTLLTCIPVFSQSAYDSRFIEYPTYNGDDLELTVDASGTHFRLWSPKAQEARVNLYDNGHAGKPYRTLEMKPDPDNGTWNASVPQNFTANSIPSRSIGTASGKTKPRECGPRPWV